MRLRKVWSLFQGAFAEWNAGNVPRLGAALAYYSVFSIAPLLLLAIVVASLIFGEEAARAGLAREIEGTVGAPVAHAIQETLRSQTDATQSTGATIVGIAILVLGAAGVFGQLQDALNTIWKAPPRQSGGVWGFLRDRFVSLSMVTGSCFLLLVSLAVSTALSATGTAVSNMLPGGVVLWQIVNAIVSFAIITILFAAIFKFVPDVYAAWRDVWTGAALTAALFVVGKFALGWYLGQASTTSAYGAAGSLVVILLWVYYASQILLFGAAFTRVHAQHRLSAPEIVKQGHEPGLLPHGMTCEGNPVRVTT